jgi:hypothetical protein
MSQLTANNIAAPIAMIVQPTVRWSRKHSSAGAAQSPIIANPAAK